ncbi:hypothetical protein [Burkholderia ubonensis]|uniref:hypothetical protein n=1 Tax=Burkholderia ubonensis TaxID=101571 RepID=UPI0012F8B519|nr:hypothetical protein [Burkholderia ubonensis]
METFSAISNLSTFTMAIEMSSLPPPAAPLPPPPSRLRWAVVFLACALIGMAIGLLIWPRHLPTATPLFWIAVVGVSLVVASTVVVIRFRAYAGLERAAKSWDARRDAHVADVFRVESRPIVLLAGAYRFSHDDAENTASAIAGGDLLLKSQTTPDKTTAIEARWFGALPYTVGEAPADYDASRQLAVLDGLIAKLLDPVVGQIEMLPPALPLVVRLHVTAPALTESVEERFQLAWRQRGLRDVSAANDPEAPGLMSLDAWLDAPSGDARDHATLLVVIELHSLMAERPPKGSAEAGVVLLMAPVDVAQRSRLAPVAQIHRPRQGTVAALRDTLAFALRWGETDAGAIQHLWHSGFDRVGQQALLSATRAGGITLMAEQRISGEHDLDRTVGDSGIAADWLALACACDFAQTFGGPQLVARQSGRESILGVVRATNRPSFPASL